MKRYVELSQQIHVIFEKFTPQIEPISLDEAFLDVKPDGFVVINEENKQQILDPLPVSNIWGVGKVTKKALKSKGINTIGQLRKAPAEILRSIFGDQTPHMLRLTQGVDNREVESSREAKSISSEQTFATDITDKNILLNVLLNQVEDVAQRLRTNDLEARTITLKLRYDDFRTVTRSNTFDLPTNITKTIWQEAEAIFLKWHKKSAGALRLLGFGVSGLQEAGSGQHQLFSEPDHDKQKRLDEAFDRIREKFGHDALRRGK